MGKIRVVLVEDHTILRETLALTLALEKDISVIGHWKDAESILPVLETIVCDVALIDKSLPGLDGIALARKIRSTCPSVKIIILSMFDRERDVLEAFDSGASGYLLKEISMEELTKAIRMVVRGEQVLDSELTKRLLNFFLKKDKAKKQDLLSIEQTRILSLMSRGSTNKEISSTLTLSSAQVKNHIQELFRILQAKDRASAIAKAFEMGLLPLAESPEDNSASRAD